MGGDRAGDTPDSGVYALIDCPPNRLLPGNPTIGGARVGW